MAVNQSGQATLEYILLIAAIVTGVMLVSQKLSDLNLAARLTAPVTGSFAKTYRYGHPKAKGYDDGGPQYHPRATDKGGNNFRIFINPGKV
jgi:hypothetical protein